MERYYGILWKVSVDGICMYHGPSPASLAGMADAYRKINPESDIVISALIRPDHLKEMNA